MRILITHHLPLEGSVSGRLTRGLAETLVEAGHEVFCLVVQGKRWPASEARGFELEQVRCWPGDAHAHLAFELPAFGVHPATRLSFETLRDDQIVEYRNALRRVLDRTIERFDPHLIHCQHAWLFAHLALESGAPYVIGVLGEEWRTLSEAPRYRRLVEQAVENASRLIVHHDEIAAQTMQLYPESAGRIERLAPPICRSAYVEGTGQTLESLNLRRGLPLVVHASNLTPECGADLLLNAKAALASRGREFALVLCGDGALRSELEAQARLQQLDDVHFIGERINSDRTALLAAADLAVAAGEGFETCYASFDALACGTPVVAVRHGGIAELISPEVGAVVESRDHELLAENIERALAERWKASKGAAVRQVAEALCANSSQRHIAIYEETLRQRYGSRPLP